MGATASSSTWSRTSTRSFTSDRTAAVLGGLVRLVHPFPSMLDGLVVAGVALIAGGELGTSVRLGVSMTALQVSIGALNDIVDAPRDRGSKPGKPIPAGLVSRDVAAVMAIISGGAGLVLGWMSGPALLLLGIAVLAIGYGYDLVFKGTAWSWLPFAVGIPLLPVYGWVGAAGTVPSSFVVLIPVAVLAGAALAVANARADEARDRRAGTASVATALGDPWSWRLNAVLLGGVVLAAAVTLIAGESAPAALAAAAGARTRSRAIAGSAWC